MQGCYLLTQPTGASHYCVMKPRGVSARYIAAWSVKECLNGTLGAPSSVRPTAQIKSEPILQLDAVEHGRRVACRRATGDSENGIPVAWCALLKSSPPPCSTVTATSYQKLILMLFAGPTRAKERVADKVAVEEAEDLTSGADEKSEANPPWDRAAYLDTP